MAQHENSPSTDIDGLFESPFFLIAWAKEQLDELDALADIFFNADNHTIVNEFNRKTGQNEVKVKIAPVPMKFRGKTTAIITDLRSTLDQAVASASTYITGQVSPKRHFPFGQSPSDLENSLSLKKNGATKGIPVELYPLLRRFEPYPTGDGYAGGDNILKALSRISGPNKHQVTIRTAFAPQSTGIGNFNIQFTDGGGAIFPWLSQSGRNDELVILSFSPGSYAQMEIDVSAYIAFDDPKMRRVPVIAFLRECHDRVTKVVEDLKAEALVIGRR